MSNYPVKEKYEDEWNGKQVKFTRTYRGYRLSDEECEKLCSGESIVIDGLTSKKSGNMYAIKVRLADLEYNGYPYVGIEDVEFVNSKLFPKSLCHHEFTEDERILLEQGEKVLIEGYVSKEGKNFDCYTTYSKEEGIKFHFQN